MLKYNWNKTKHWNCLKQFQACFSLVSIYSRV